MTAAEIRLCHRTHAAREADGGGRGREGLGLYAIAVQEWPASAGHRPFPEFRMNDSPASGPRNIEHGAFDEWPQELRTLLDGTSIETKTGFFFIVIAVTCIDML